MIQGLVRHSADLFMYLTSVLSWAGWLGAWAGLLSAAVLQGLLDELGPAKV